MKKRSFIALALVLGTAAGRANAQSANSRVSTTKSPAAEIRAVEKFMTELYRRGQFNGAILIANRKGIVYRAAFVLANRETKSPFTPDTPSCLASLSKPLTSLAVMMLAEKGSIKYDDHISQYIPELIQEC